MAKQADTSYISYSLSS